MPGQGKGERGEGYSFWFKNRINTNGRQENTAETQRTQRTQSALSY